MIEKLSIIAFFFCMIFLFSLNLNKKLSDKNYETLKNKKSTWYWFKVFNISQSKENFVIFHKLLSVLAITIMLLSLIFYFK